MRGPGPGLLSIAAAVTLAAAASLASQQNPQAPVFRSTVTLVPIDVRVLDARTRQPVTDLKREDFQVLENGVPQQIRHFELQALAPEAPAAGAESISMRGATPASAAVARPLRKATTALSPQHNRLFLIVLGTGRLSVPSKGLEALLRFVRTRLLPQDLAAILAYDRATDFTTDHERLARIIERFERENNAIDSGVQQAAGGLAAVYGRRSLPEPVQLRIDRVFEADGALASRVVGTAMNAVSGARMEEDLRKQIDGEAVAGAGFDAFISSLWLMRRDLAGIYAGLAYLRELDGEKHLLFVTEYGFLLPRVEDDEDLVRAASDARVTLNILQTGGLAGGTTDVPIIARALRSIAADSGGLASFFEYSQPALERLDAATRSSYLLGYYPSDAKRDMRFRRIQVRVNRRGLVVLFRRGYFAREVPAFSRRGFMVRQRLLSAAWFPKPITDIGIRFTAQAVDAKGDRQARIDARIDPGNLYFTNEQGMHVGRIDIGQFAVNDRGKISSEGWQTVDLQFTEDTFRRISTAGIPYRVRMPVTDDVTQVVLAVYDYMADRVGSARVRLK